MMLGHDGHDVICGNCRVPLRVALVSSAPIQLGHDQLLLNDPEREYVSCDNCGSDIGSFEDVSKQYERLVQTQPDPYHPLSAAAALAADLRRGGTDVGFPAVGV